MQIEMDLNPKGHYFLNLYLLFDINEIILNIYYNYIGKISVGNTYSIREKTGNCFNGELKNGFTKIFKQI